MAADVMHETSYGRAALRKLGAMAPVGEAFRLYAAEWLGGSKPEEWHAMKVTGAEFREATRGPNKGKRTVRVQNSTRIAIVTIEEMRAEDAAACASVASTMLGGEVASGQAGIAAHAEQA